MSMDIFKLMDGWFSFASEQTKLNGNHTALFFFCVELNNKLAWKDVFGLPTYESADYIGMSPNTFRKCLNDLVAVNIIKMVKKSPNQFTSNQISMGLAYQKLLKLSKGKHQSFIKAQLNQLLKRCTIDKQTNKETIEQINILKAENESMRAELLELKGGNIINSSGTNSVKLSLSEIKANKIKAFKMEVNSHIESLNGRGEFWRNNNFEQATEFCDYWTESKPRGKKLRWELQDVFDLNRRFKTWQNRAEKNSNEKFAPTKKTTTLQLQYLVQLTDGKRPQQMSQASLDNALENISSQIMSYTDTYTNQVTTL